MAGVQTTHIEPLQRLYSAGQAPTNSDYLTVTFRSLPGLRDGINIADYGKWSAKELGVGFAPSIEILEDINGHGRESIRIFFKPEYLNAGGGGKAGPVSFTLLVS